MNLYRTLLSLGAALLVGVIALGGIPGQRARGQEPPSDTPAEIAEETPAEVESLPEPDSDETQPAESEEQEEPVPPPQFPSESHLWGRFPTGSYRVLRTVTETFNPDGSLLGKSVTTKHEVLKAVVDDAYVLDVKAAVDLDGKQVAGDWKTRALKLATDAPGRLVESADLGVEEVEVQGEPVECRLWEFRYADETETIVQRTHFNAKRFPYTMRVSRRVLAEDEEDAPEETLQMEVTATPVPYLLRGRIVSGCRALWTRRSAKGRTIRSVFLCETVPGGAVESSSTDIDAEGRRVRHSVTELVDYQTGPVEDAGSSVGVGSEGGDSPEPSTSGSQASGAR